MGLNVHYLFSLKDSPFVSNYVDDMTVAVDAVSAGTEYSDDSQLDCLTSPFALSPISSRFGIKYLIILNFFTVSRNRLMISWIAGVEAGDGDFTSTALESHLGVLF